MTKNLQPLKGKYTNEKTLINIYNDRNISKISKIIEIFLKSPKMIENFQNL